jgi:hypothetical protein
LDYHSPVDGKRTRDYSDVAVVTKKPTKTTERATVIGGQDGVDTSGKSGVFGDSLMETLQRLLEQVRELKREGKEQQATIQELHRIHQDPRQQNLAKAQELQRLLLESKQRKRGRQARRSRLTQGTRAGSLSFLSPRPT